MTDDVAEDPDAPGEPEPRRARRARKGQDDDPFANLVLDELFVKGASVYEAPARTRAAVRRCSADEPTATRARRRTRRSKTPAQPPSPRDWSPADRGRPRRRGRMPIGVGAVVVLALGAGYLVFAHEGRQPAGPAARGSAALTASPSAQATKDIELTNRRYGHGNCYLWDQTATASDVDEVSCDRPHLFEAGAGELAGGDPRVHLHHQVHHRGEPATDGDRRPASPHTGRPRLTNLARLGAVIPGQVAAPRPLPRSPSSRG